MQVNNNLSPIPFYRSLSEQDRNKWYSSGVQYCHYAPSDALLPFHICLPNDGEAHFSLDACVITFYRKEGDVFNVVDGSSVYADKLRSHCLRLVEGESYDTMIYYANIGISTAEDIGLPSGMYYLDIAISDDVDEPTISDHLYSEVFAVSDRESLLSSKVRLEWWCTSSLECGGGIVPFGIRGAGNIQYKSVVYLDTEIAMPEYTFTEEGDERNGLFYPTKQISEKLYKMRFVAPEWLCDTLRLVRMADYCYVRFAVRNGSSLAYRTNEVTQFESDVEWLEQGFFADVSCSFKTDTIVKKVGKIVGGDFNNDFNNDFDI